MKRFALLLGIVITICFSKSNAQTPVPFYGFELSNYEVGDTLEYDYTEYAGGGYYLHDTIAWIFLDKQFNSVSTIVYTIRQIENGETWNMGPTSYFYVTDTILRALTNDSVSYNTNNLFNKPLIHCNALDTANCTFIFDTVNNLKHLDVLSLSFPMQYEAFENIGITDYSANFGSSTTAFHLLYANLAHYGGYGAWEPLSSVLINTKNALVVNYNNENKTLQIISNEHLNGSLKLYDLLGRCVLLSGLNESPVHLNNLITGMYFYSIIGSETQSGKIMIR